MERHPPDVSRRALLGAGLAALVVTPGCAPTPGPAPQSVTVRALTKERPFYIARHGGSGDWPEMTAYAYDQAAALPGVQALEVSVCRSADGVLVCSLDPTTLRVTGKDYTILDETWATLSTLTVKATRTSEPTQPRRRLARLEEVLDAHLGSSVIIVEPRVDEAVGPLMALLTSTGRPESIVWRQPVNSPRFAEAKRHGFSTYGYVLNEPPHRRAILSGFTHSATLDLLGTSVKHEDLFVGRVARAAQRTGLTMVAWDVFGAAQRDRLLRLGCSGLSSSRIRELLATVPTVPPSAAATPR